MPGKKKATKKTAAAKEQGHAKKPAAKEKPAGGGRARAGAAPNKAGAPKRETAEPQGLSASEPLHAETPAERPADPEAEQRSPLSPEELQEFEKLLLNLRDQVVDEISSLTADNLSGKTFGRTGEEGTDNFNREFALKLVSSEQDIIYEIDEALRRIASGTYGLCEVSGEPIEKERLKVMPHARHCVRVQSELERGRIRYRPFSPPSVRGD